MENFFITSAGKRIEVEAVPPLLIEEVRLRAHKTVEVPPVPTYDVELLDGSKQTFQHDADSIVDPNTSEKERAAWAAYQAALQRQATVSATRIMDLFLARGVKIDPQELQSGTWRELQEYFGIELPSNPIEARIHYIRTELLTTAEDINGVIQAIMGASGIDPEVLQAAKNSFRDKLREAQDAAARAGGAVQLEGTGQVVHEPAL